VAADQVGEALGVLWGQAADVEGKRLYALSGVGRGGGGFFHQDEGAHMGQTQIEGINGKDLYEARVDAAMAGLGAVGAKRGVSLAARV
jgi:hypothetical protein